MSGPAPGGLAALAHELRSPVAALQAVSAAFADAGLEPRQRRELVELALAACSAIERLVGEAAVASLRPEAVDPGALLRQAAAAAALGGARVRVEAAPGLPPLQADPVRLRQALDNLVRNALVHAGPDAEVVLAARLVEDGRLALTVADSGPGIPAEAQRRIFAPGVRLGAEAPGEGLGLAVVRAIAEAHGGEATVRSEPGRGTTFALLLPARAPAPG